MAKSPPPYPKQIENDFRRKPDWRWERANDLIHTGCYATKRRDDTPTRITVEFLREVNRCRSDLRLRRVRKRFQYLAQAHDIWLAGGAQQLEIETRVLANQSDTAIGLEMGLPAPTIQAYCDVFFAIRDRLHAGSYIAFQIIGVHPQRSPSPVQLMQLWAFRGGPHMIQPWMDYLREPHRARDLNSDEGRVRASLDFYIAVQRLSDDEKTAWSLMSSSPFFLKNDWNFSVSRSIRRAFHKSTAGIVGQLQLSDANLPPYSYAPASSLTRSNTNTVRNRRAA